MPTLREFLDETLSNRTPSTVEELTALAQDAGATRARNAVEVVRSALRRSQLAIPLVDGRWSCPRQLLDGVVLTHRVRTSTAHRLDLWPRDDLFPFLPLFDRAVPLTSGGLLQRWSDSPARALVLIGPPGWLPAVAAGSLLAFRWQDDSLHVGAVEVDPDATAERVELLRETVAYHHDKDAVGRWQPILASSMTRALLEVPDLLTTPLPPLGQILGDLLSPPPEKLSAADPPRCCCRRYGHGDDPLYYEDEGWLSVPR